VVVSVPSVLRGRPRRRLAIPRGSGPATGRLAIQSSISSSVHARLLDPIMRPGGKPSRSMRRFSIGPDLTIPPCWRPGKPTHFVGMRVLRIKNQNGAPELSEKSPLVIPGSSTDELTGRTALAGDARLALGPDFLDRALAQPQFFRDQPTGRHWCVGIPAM